MINEDSNKKFDIASHLQEIPLLGRQYVPKFWQSVESSEDSLASTSTQKGETVNNNQMAGNVWTAEENVSLSHSSSVDNKRRADSLNGLSPASELKKMRFDIEMRF